MEKIDTIKNAYEEELALLQKAVPKEVLEKIFEQEAAKRQPQQCVSIGLFMNWKETTPDGKVVRDTGEVLCKSFTVQFLKLLEGMLGKTITTAANAVSVNDTSNTARSCPDDLTTSQYTYYMAAESAGGDVTYGIVVGTSTTSVSLTDYQLFGLIAHGTGSGQLSYGACAVGPATINGSNVDINITRAFINGSGSQITVEEVGLIVSSNDTAATTRYFLVSRDLSTQAIANGNTGTCTLTIRTSL